MSNFQQQGTITTIPRLTSRKVQTVENELAEYSRISPLCLIIPSLASEMDQPALEGIVKTLTKIPYLDTMIVSLDRATEDEYQRSLHFFADMGIRTVIIWNDAPEMLKLVARIEKSVMQSAPRGKGRAVWMALGCAIAEHRYKVLAIHDADVLTYNRSFLANLVYPVMHPLLTYDFCKAFYARFTNRLHGRVTRLLMRPLLQALEDIVGQHPFLSFVSAYRYPLSGEMAFDIDLARWVRVPGDWGLEVGILFEMLRQRSPRRMCQVDISDQFEHKHQELSPTDASTGLHRMAVDIVKHFLRASSAAGLALHEGTFCSLRVAYQKYAEDAVSDSYTVSVFNGLKYDRHSEELNVDTFSKALKEGCDQFSLDPLGTPALPNWARVEAACPDILEKMLSIVKSREGILNTS